MEPVVDTQVIISIITVIGSVIASSGFWAFWQKKTEKNDASKEMLVGLGHDRIVSLGLKYIEQGYITHDEYENLSTYLYLPYKKLGGNGSAEQVMRQVDQLPIHASLDDCTK